MDPTWMVRITAPWRDAQLFLFRGPHLEVAWFDPRQPEAGPYVEGYDDVTPAAITAVLQRLTSQDGNG
jgi:hypothetical protein